MSASDPRPGARRLVLVSQERLRYIAPEVGSGVGPRPRAAGRLPWRVRLALGWYRLRFRLLWLNRSYPRLVAWRLRARLLWTRWRYARRLPRPRVAARTEPVGWGPGPALITGSNSPSL